MRQPASGAAAIVELFVTKPTDILLTGLLCAVILAGCGKPEQAPSIAPVQVSIATAVNGPVAMTDELPGRVVALRTAEIRPQVGGIIQKRLFTEGATVRAGQPLFQINTAPFQADANAAAAALQRALAVRDRARLQVDRLKPLIETDAVSRQTVDDAASTLAQAQADVAAAQAALARRRLDLRFATITAPIAGRIGAAAISEGALVNVGDTTALASIQQIGQVYIDVRQPATRLTGLSEEAMRSAPVTVLDADGRPTGLMGRLMFSERRVDPATGDVTVRVLVDNPSGQLLPGMFVRVGLPRGPAQLLPRVPQQAVFHAGPQALVMLFAGDGRVKTRNVRLGEVIDNSYVIVSGVSPGDRVVVEGRDRVRPDVKVQATAWRKPVR